VTDKVVIYVTSGSLEEGEKIAQSLVEKHLAACVNIIPQVRSYYRWEGKIENEAEFLLMVKTSRGLFADVQAEVERLHSYQVPEVICLPIIDGSPNYLAWLGESLKAGG